MASISVADVSKLRKQTGAGMLDCKNALQEANGDFELAFDILRKKGNKIAAKRADRDSREGVALARVTEDGSFGVALSVNCETDFVAINEGFIALAENVIKIAIDKKCKDVDSLLSATFDDKLSVQDKLTEQTGVIGEKIELGNFNFFEGDGVASYIHSGNKIAVLVSLSKKVADFSEIGKNVAMQVAAMNPVSVSIEEVDEKIREREFELALEQAKEEGKPADKIEQIAKGKLNKFFKENTLLAQGYIKENKMSVLDYLKSIDKDLTVKSFVRIALG